MSDHRDEKLESLLARPPRRSDAALSLLYVLADAAPTGVGELLTDVAISALPAANRDSQACESPRDLELLVRTMAIEGLAQVADRNGAELTQRQLVSVLERQMEPGSCGSRRQKHCCASRPASADPSSGRSCRTSCISQSTCAKPARAIFTSSQSSTSRSPAK